MIEWLLIIILLVYAAFMLVMAAGFLRLPTTREKPGIPGELPGISVVIAARNEAGKLPALLGALGRQTYDRSKMEVVVVDDQSDDATPEVVNGFLEVLPLRYLRLNGHDGPAGKKGALAFGIAHAFHPVILVTDADCTVPEGWVEEYAHLFVTSGCKLAAGVVQYNNPQGFWQCVEALDFYGMVATSAGAAGCGCPFLCNGANMGFLRDDFHQVGGFRSHAHLSSGDDVFLLHRFIQAFGTKSIRWNLSRESRVFTSGASSFGAFLWQRLRWASKSTSYRNPMAIATSLMVLMANFAVVAGAAISALIRDPMPAILLFPIKAISDLPLTVMIIRHFRQWKLLLWYVPATLLYPFYTTFLGFASFVARTGWKGRRVR